MGDDEMAHIDVTEIRIILEDQLTQILENNGYHYKGSEKVLIKEIMTKISHDIIIEELDTLGAI